MTYYRKQKFSLKYRIEKWFYEDSIRLAIKLFKVVASTVLCGAMFACLFFIPALFH
jgi:hypothetical protein